MEVIHGDGTPLQAYLEGHGSYQPDGEDDSVLSAAAEPEATTSPASFAPTSEPITRQQRGLPLSPLKTVSKPQSSIAQVHYAWSSAVNARLGQADNARFLEHFRYILVASQLLNEYFDHGSLQSAPVLPHGGDAARDEVGLTSVATSPHGVVVTAVFAFAVVFLIHWARSSRGGYLSKSRVALVIAVFAVLALVGYAYTRRQWLKYLRQQAVSAESDLTANWHAFEVSSSSALSFIQEVELVSRGYRLSTPLPPASRIEENGTSRRCVILRKALHKAYFAVIPVCIHAINTLQTLIDMDDLDKYFEVYDINAQDAKEASGSDALAVLEDDPQSLKSLRVLSYRAGVLRRVVLCHLMSLEVDGGKIDFHRWRMSTEAMLAINTTISSSVERLRAMLTDMETLQTPVTPSTKTSHRPSREKMRSQVRKISALSSGIRGLQAKMQILREETNRSIETSCDDLTDLGPHLKAQYESIGADLRELMAAWEAGKASLQSNLSKQERRVSLASSGLRSPVSSLGGLTAVEEDGTPADALRALNGDTLSSKRSSMATTPSDEEAVFEAIAMPRRRSTMTREERISKVYGERERQAALRQKRDASTSMLKELESVISLRPKKNEPSRITSI